MQNWPQKMAGVQSDIKNKNYTLTPSEARTAE